MGEDRWNRFKATLDEFHVWPCPYTFKFVVPKDRVEELIPIFGDQVVKRRESRKGNYVSLTAEWVVTSSEEVAAIYMAAEQFEGVIAL